MGDASSDVSQRILNRRREVAARRRERDSPVEPSWPSVRKARRTGAGDHMQMGMQIHVGRHPPPPSARKGQTRNPAARGGRRDEIRRGFRKCHPRTTDDSRLPVPYEPPQGRDPVPSTQDVAPVRDSATFPQPLFELWRHLASVRRRRVARPQAASFCTLFTARRRWGGVQPARFWRPTNSADSPLLHRIRGRKCEVRANLRTSREPDELRARQTDAARETEAANQTDATRQRL